MCYWGLGDIVKLIKAEKQVILKGFCCDSLSIKTDRCAKLNSTFTPYLSLSLLLFIWGAQLIRKIKKISCPQAITSIDCIKFTVTAALQHKP